MAIAAARAGKHVLCEKPFAMNLDEAEAMLAAAEGSGVTHLVGHEFRWAVDRAVVGRAIADGAIGEPRLATFISYVPLVADPAARTPEWWFDPGSGGGWLGASGSHVIDQIRTWLGDFAEVSARLNVVSERAGVAEDSFTVRFRLTNGVEGVLQQTAARGVRWLGSPALPGRREPSGSTATSRGSPTRMDHVAYRCQPISSCPGSPERATTRATASRISSSARSRGCASACSRVPRAVRCRVAVAVPTFADGVAEMRVMDAIRASAVDNGATTRV